ncbi:hypothetical protein PILCRDRAFT_17419 [Piloderma croceum F 1598]|uniref:Uncharacterized protein n=1 Tax=Piloderma croceum (strain F 1598) TaxID=765440 RepID=A0A0C3ETD4_PILCF|nr:hypothetical protein PILCRDRAFT_17419 [Piloderma croceum F 1598]
MASNDNVTVSQRETEGVVAQRKDIEAAGITPSLIPHTHLEHLDTFLEADQSQHLYFARHDGKVHDPLGAGSYIFEKEYVPSLMRYMGLPLEGNEFVNRTSRLATSAVVHIGAQPNNSPHAGTIVVFILAFLIAQDIKKFYRELRTGDISEEFRLWIDDFQILVRLDLVDTAPAAVAVRKMY